MLHQGSRGFMRRIECILLSRLENGETSLDEVAVELGVSNLSTTQVRRKISLRVKAWPTIKKHGADKAATHTTQPETTTSLGAQAPN